jgi:cardiolipin synthase
MLVLVQPWIGLVLYMAIGRPRLPRGREQMMRKVSQVIRAAQERDQAMRAAVATKLPEPFARAAALAHSLGDFETLDGNHFEWLDDYHASIDHVVADIKAAHHHVHLLYYIFADDVTGGQVADALIAAAKRGVSCIVLMDATGSKKGLKLLAPRLKQVGIEVVPVLPVGLFRRNRGRYDLRNHRKIAVIDGRVGYVGSQNLVNENFKAPLVFEDVVARITGPVVQQLQAVLLADRYFETGTDPDIESHFPTPQCHGDALAITLPSGPGYPYANNLDVTVALIHAARRRVMITSPYFIPSESLTQAMQSAAMRGVEVRLIVSSKRDQFLVGFAQRSYYRELLVAGVHIHAYLPHFLHAKHLTIDDDIAMIGSSNMDIRSFALNQEINVLIDETDAAAGLRKIQDRYLANSTELNLTEWDARPPLTKFAENLARLTDSLL